MGHGRMVLPPQPLSDPQSAPTCWVLRALPAECLYLLIRTTGHAKPGGGEGQCVQVSRVRWSLTRPWALHTKDLRDRPSLGRLRVRGTYSSAAHGQDDRDPGDLTRKLNVLIDDGHQAPDMRCIDGQLERAPSHSFLPCGCECRAPTVQKWPARAPETLELFRQARLQPGGPVHF